MRHPKLLMLPLLLLLGCLLLSNLPAAAQGAGNTVYLPLVTRPPARSLFGFEISPNNATNPQIRAHASDLGAYWVRLNGVVWSQIEPVRGAGYNWATLSQFDAAVIEAKTLGMTPVVIVRGTPAWAAVTNSGCAAVRDEHIADFAAFMAALTQRYKDTVSYWEIWNEPDVDPRLVPSDYPFGCWGNIDDPYYGGERYGRMLQAIAPAMRGVNPAVKIVLGGLLLDRPLTTNPSFGRPELFLEGILRSGAAGSFDILAYHAYPSYTGNSTYDHDLYDLGNIWSGMGGWTLGKARYLREMMARYGVSKPLWLNETGLICRVNSQNQCLTTPGADFYNAQADHLVRIISRAAAANIEQVSWYTLDGPGWRSGALLDGAQNPRPAFDAYDRLIDLIGGYSSASAIADYGSEIEAYRFTKSGGVVDVLWSRSGNSVIAQLPFSAYRSAMIWNGATPSTSPNGSNMLVLVGFQAVFIERTP